MPHTCMYGVGMGENVYDSAQTEYEIQQYVKLLNLHRELASYYRAKSRDRRTIANLWYYIDGLEMELRAMGAEIGIMR